MDKELFHIFRNTPLGRETLMQSVHFCRQVGAYPVIYIPQSTKFLMYFENDVVQVDLDESYLTDPPSARRHAEEIVGAAGLKPVFFEPKHFTASTLPDIPTHYDYMCCPRSISDLSHKIGLGYIGPRVRRIVKSAHFPVLITSPAYKPWNGITVLFGGSNNAIKALRLGIQLCRQSGCELTLFTQVEGGGADRYDDIIRENNLEAEVRQYVKRWDRFESGKLESNLYEVPHNALVVMGAYGHGVIRDLVFGSKMERIQATITNNLLVVGPNYTARL